MKFSSCNECNEICSEAVKSRDFGLCEAMQNVYTDLFAEGLSGYAILYNDIHYIYVNPRGRKLFKTRKMCERFAFLTKADLPYSDLSKKGRLNEFLFKNVGKAHVEYVEYPSGDHCYWRVTYEDHCCRVFMVPVCSKEVHVIVDI